MGSKEKSDVAGEVKTNVKSIDVPRWKRTEVKRSHSSEVNRAMMV